MGKLWDRLLVIADVFSVEYKWETVVNCRWSIEKTHFLGGAFYVFFILVNPIAEGFQSILFEDHGFWISVVHQVHDTVVYGLYTKRKPSKVQNSNSVVTSYTYITAVHKD